MLSHFFFLNTSRVLSDRPCKTSRIMSAFLIFIVFKCNYVFSKIKLKYIYIYYICINLVQNVIQKFVQIYENAGNKIIIVRFTLYLWLTIVKFKLTIKTKTALQDYI